MWGGIPFVCVPELIGGGGGVVEERARFVLALFPLTAGVSGLGLPFLLRII